MADGKEMGPDGAHLLNSSRFDWSGSPRRFYTTFTVSLLPIGGLVTCRESGKTLVEQLDDGELLQWFHVC